MKKYIGFILVMMILVAQFGCKKESMDNYGEKEVQSIFERWTLRTCVFSDGLHYFGVKCVWGFVDNCPQRVSCQPLYDDGGNKIPLEIAHPVLVDWGFTYEEIAQWMDGFDVLGDPTPEDIQEKYEFYLHMWENGVALHPDTIIMLMEN